MPEYSFVATHRWVKQIARQHHIQISSRKAEKVAAAWMDHAELEADGVANVIRLHADPTGDEAVKVVLALLRSQP